MTGRREKFEGCLLGCAVGDSLGLPYEALKPRRVRKFLKLPLEHRFVFGRGMVSDDTDHTVFVAQALCRHPDDPAAFARCLSWKLRWWLLCLPAGIGLATWKSILRLWAGFPPYRSGVLSAGNGAAMRSAIIGACLPENPDLRKAMVTASSRITHSDPKAEYGAQAVAVLAAHAVEHGDGRPSIAELGELLDEVSEEDHWREVVSIIVRTSESGRLTDALAAGADRKGVSGYVYHTVPVAIAAWYLHHGDFRATIESVVKLGGDTDTVAAIAGSLAGAVSGRAGIPEEWIAGIIDRPHGPVYLSRLAAALESGNADSDADAGVTRISPLLFPRGIVFTIVVLIHVFRRWLPPY